MPLVAVPRPGETKEYLKGVKQAEARGLGEKIKVTLLETFTGALTRLFTWLISAFLQATQQVLESIEVPYSHLVRSLAEKAEKTGQVPREMDALVDEIKQPKRQAGAFVIGAFGGMAASGLAQTVLEPLLAPLRYALWFQAPWLEINPEQASLLLNLGVLDEKTYYTIMLKNGYNVTRADWLRHLYAKRLEPGEIIPLLTRKRITREEAEKLLESLGYNPQAAHLMTNLAETLLSAAEIQELHRRGEISTEEARAKLAEQGFSPETIGHILSLERRLLGPGEVRDLYWWGSISRERAVGLLRKLGYSEEDAAKIIDASWATPDITTIRDGYLRGLWSDEEVDRMLARQGIREEEREVVKRLFWVLPSVSDLIRMAVREVFTPEIAEKFGLYEDFPEDFARYAKMVGLSEEWARAYWAAHWELPSLEMGYEMLHRGIITEEELRMLLRAQDVMPFWREKLIQLSYSPFTRVDVRRMYQMGVLSKEDVLKAYKDLGYDDWHAQKLTEFTVMGASEEERDLTKTDILGGYRDGILTRDEARDALVKLGYDREEAEFYLEREDYKAEKERRDTIIKIWKELYITRRVTQNDVIRALSQVNLPASQIDTLISSWEAEREAQMRTPTLSDLRKYFKKGIIDEATFRHELEVLGFSARYIDWIVQDAKGE